MMKVLRKLNLRRLAEVGVAQLCDGRKLVKLVAHQIKVHSIEARRVRLRFEELKL